MSYRGLREVKPVIEDEGEGEEEIVQKKKAEEDEVDGGEDHDDNVNQLALQVDALNISYKLEVVELMYHVTRSTANLDNILKEGFQHNRAHCAEYDGPLLRSDAPAGIFFTITRYHGYNHVDHMPTITQYPRETYHPEGLYPRIAVLLADMKLATDYSLFLIKEATTPEFQNKETLQLHVAFIHKSRKADLKWAKRYLTPLDSSVNGIMYFQENRRWMAPSQKQYEKCDLWTNVFLVPAESDRLLGPLKTAVVGYVEKRTSNYKFKKKGKYKEPLKRY